jgi:hypothetical protein
MAFIFQIKRVGSNPTSGALASGELGYNTSTKQLFVGNGAASASAVSMVGHTHTKSQITDFPTSLPASDVYAWAKAATKPSYSLSEVSGHISESQGGVEIFGYPNDSTTLLFLGDDGTFEHNGYTIITSANISGYVSSGAAIASIKNWTNYVTCTGTTGAALPVTASSFIDGYLGIVWNATPSSAQGRNVSWIKLNQGTDSMYKAGVSAIRPGSTTTATYIDRFVVSGSPSGNLLVDDIYYHIINDTASEAHPIGQTTIYVWDVLKMTL